MNASELEKKLGKKKHKTTSELKQVMKARSDQNPNFCLLLGAGASRSSGIRTASQLVDEWRAIAYKGLSNDAQERSVQEMKNWLTEHEPEWYDEKREYQDAIDAIESIPDRRDFAEKFTSELSFLELKMGAPAKAVKRCRAFLEERSFSPYLAVQIVNYEYGKKMDGGKIDKKRISAVADTTEDEMVKGTCHSLLDQDGDAIKLFRAESEKRFSKIEDCLRWPVIQRHQKELKSIREELLKAKRGLNDLPSSS